MFPYVCSQEGDNKDALKSLNSFKHSKSDELKKMTAALETARSRGEALARELASTRQEHERYVRSVFWELLLLPLAVVVPLCGEEMPAAVVVPHARSVWSL